MADDIAELTPEMEAEARARGAVFPYFRPNGVKGESAYPTFEWGYAVMAEGEGPGTFRIVAKRVIGEVADVLLLARSPASRPDPNFNAWSDLMVDVTLDGYWRIMSARLWDERNAAYGSAELVFAPRKGST